MTVQPKGRLEIGGSILGATFGFGFLTLAQLQVPPEHVHSSHPPALKQLLLPGPQPAPLKTPHTQAPIGPHMHELSQLAPSHHAPGTSHGAFGSH